MLLLLQSATDTQSIEVMSCEFNTERREALKTPLALFETVSENVDRAVVCSRGEIGGWNDRWNVEPCSDGDTESDGSCDSERSSRNTAGCGPDVDSDENDGVVVELTSDR